MATDTWWAHHELEVPRLELYVEPWNTASIRTAEGPDFGGKGCYAAGKKSVVSERTCSCTRGCPPIR